MTAITAQILVQSSMAGRRHNPLCRLFLLHMFVAEAPFDAPVSSSVTKRRLSQANSALKACIASACYKHQNPRCTNGQLVKEVKLRTAFYKHDERVW